MAPSDLSRGPYRGKRAVDLALAAIFVVPALGLGIVAAVAIKTTSRGSIFFLQERVGRDGKPFDVYKFRTMLTGDNPLVPSDDRITRAGKWLRRFSIDELPQLINVVRGEMSFVGPRPTLQYQVNRYTAEQRRRLDVRPGLTGWAQINGRNAIEWDKRIELDIEYVIHQSAALDAKIVIRTFTTLLSGEGVEGHSSSDPLVATKPSQDSAHDF